MSREKLSSDPSALKAILTFITVFIIAVILWIPVKDYYCYAITLAATKLLARVNDAMISGISAQGDTFSITLSLLKSGHSPFSVVTISTGTSRYYAFNVPLTVSLIATLFLFIGKRTRACIEAAVLLLLSHLLYVFFAEAASLKELLMLRGVEPANTARLAFYQYLWKTAEFTVMSFGPFMITTYVFVRFRR